MKAIAMRCTAEQFEEVRELVNYKHIDRFTLCPYLVNNFGGKLGLISNLCLEEVESIEYIEVHEEWNVQTFLEACGVSTPTLDTDIKNLIEKGKNLGINVVVTFE